MVQRYTGEVESAAIIRSASRQESTMGSTNSAPLGGVLPVFQTPFLDDESIDWETLEAELHWLFDRGANAVVMALASELLRLSGDERERMAQFVCETVGERGPVVVSVGAERSIVAERFARHAEASGASAVMAIPPISVSPSSAELRSYYERLLRATTLPVIIQDASGYVGQVIPLELQSQLLDEYGAARVLFKPEAVPIGPRLTALMEATGGRARIFEGSGGGALLESHRRGVSGTMSGADVHVGIVALWRALEANDDERAYRLSLPITTMVSYERSLDAFLAIEKHLLVKQGVFKNVRTRGPVDFVLDDVTRSEVDRLFEFILEAARAAD